MMTYHQQDLTISQLEQTSTTEKIILDNIFATTTFSINQIKIFKSQIKITIKKFFSMYIL